MLIRTLLLAGVAALAPAMVLSASAQSRPGPSAPADSKVVQPASADLAKLVRDFRIPYQRFTLPNGLTVLVVTDRTVPIVYAGITYDVGSSYEPVGKSGFAHLFEHLMFNGSENAPGDYFDHLKDAGSIDVNGGTSQDYTEYFQVVPTGSLDRVLFMESDRMGHLLGAVTQAVLDEQRGVVQNEKRGKDDDPTSIARHRTRAAIFPADHPYGHANIGSMKDLNAASLADVHQWFRDYYGPNNATLVLAGDIDLATAKIKVAKYFGDIPRGRDIPRPVVIIPVMKQPVEDRMTAPISSTTITRAWPMPGFDSRENFVMDAVSLLMTGIDGAPLTRKLVRDDKLFSSVTATSTTMRSVGQFSVSGQVRAGVDPRVAERALDAAIAAFLADGVSADALERFKSKSIIPVIQQQEMVEQRAARLLAAVSLQGGPADYKRDLETYVSLTVPEVRAVARKWLGRPGYRAVIEPGVRMIPPGDEQVAGTRTASAPPAAVVAPRRGTRGPLPPVGGPGVVRFPVIQHATLTNGISVRYARHDSVPFTSIILNLPFGTLDDAPDKPNVNGWMFASLGEGAGGHDDHWFRQQTERTGIRVTTLPGSDSSSMYMSGPTADLGRMLDTGMMMLTAPEFPADRLESRRRGALAALASAPTSSGTLVSTVFRNALAPGSTYAKLGALDTAAELNAVTRADLRAAFDRWVRPQGAGITVVSNEPLAALMPRLNATLGRWTASGKAPAPKAGAHLRPTQGGTPRIVLIDMPETVQATVMGGQLLSTPYTDEALASQIANLALGSDFTSRINKNLREDKHWTYGASGGFSNDRLVSSYTVSAEIQPDKVGAAIAEVRKEVQDILSDRPVTRQEFDQAIGNTLRQRVAAFRSGVDVLFKMREMEDHGWRDDFQNTFDARLKGLTLDAVNAALRNDLDPAKWVWVVAGSAKVIRPQLDDLGLPVEVVTPAQVITASR